MMPNNNRKNHRWNNYGLHIYLQSYQRSDRITFDENDVQLLKQNLNQITNNIKLADKYMFDIKVSTI